MGQIPVLMFRRVGEIPSWPQFLLLVMVAATVAFLVRTMVVRLGRRIRFQSRLQPHYERLGRHAPQDPCPCGSADSDGPRAYGACCRVADVKRLRADIERYLLKNWEHRSYAGRRWSRPMSDRVKAYPMPPVILPDWVEHPDRHSFPVAMERLSGWTPISRPVAGNVPEDADAGLPF